MIKLIKIHSIVLAVSFGLSAPVIANESGLEASVSTESGVLEQFCQKTMPAYAKAVRDGYETPVMMDLHKEASFINLERAQQQSFITLMKASSDVDPEKAADHCMDIAKRALASLNVENIKACRAWGKAAETILRSSRENGLDATREFIHFLSYRMPAIGESYRHLLNQSQVVKPGIRAEEFGSIHYRACLNAIPTEE